MTTPTRLVSLYDMLFQKQIDAIAHATGRINIWEGSIRSGKTMSSLIAWLLYVANAPRGGELVMVGKTLQTVYRNLFVPLMSVDKFGDIARQIHYTQGAPTATILGRVVHIVGANDAKAESKIRGFTCAGAYVDEATLLPEDFWMTLKGRMSVEGARIFATTNPDNPLHWLRQNEILPNHWDVRVFKFLLDDNIFLPPGFVEAQKRTFRGLYYKRNILGLWVMAEGAVYDMWDDERHIVDELPAMRQWLGIGIDHGTSNPFSAQLLGLGADNCLYVASEYYYSSKEAQGQKTDYQYANDVEKWLKNPFPGFRPTPDDVMWWVIDPSAASFRVEVKQRGHFQYAADNAVEDGIRLVSSLFGRMKLKIHRRCERLIAEIPGYSWDDEKAQKGEDTPIKADDHALDAMRYIVKSTQATWDLYVEGDDYAVASR